MNKNTLAITFTAMLLSFHVLAQKVKTTIQVTNVKPGKGSVILNIYNDKKSFLKRADQSWTLAADRQMITFAVDLPRGTYAVMIFQDLDNNGKLKKNWIGIPSEPVGNGNNFIPSGAAPRFDDCAINVTDAPQTHTIALN